jgi:hypothetical protein
MATAVTPRRMLLWCLIAASALLFAGVGQASAAQRSPAPHRTMAVHHRALAYADGPLTVARHSRRRVPVAHAAVRPSIAVAHNGPVAYADGILTGTHRRHHHRRLSVRSV